MIILQGFGGYSQATLATKLLKIRYGANSPANVKKPCTNTTMVWVVLNSFY